MPALRRLKTDILRASRMEFEYALLREKRKVLAMKFPTEAYQTMMLSACLGGVILIGALILEATR